MNNEELAKKAALNIVKMMAIKWAVIIIGTKLAKRAVKKAA